jgi:SAM-dependent methyltransferase
MFSVDKSGSSLRSICEAVEAGRIPPQVAAAQALVAGGSVKDAIDLVATARVPDSPAHTAIVSALREHRSRCDVMGAFYRDRGPLPPSGREEDTVAATARFFDDALRISPHASVALYSLGDAALLQRATDEVLQYMQGRRLLGHRRRTLELGCGSGRMQLAIGPYVLEAAGADVSSAMIDAANKRRKGLSTVRFFHAPAHRLSQVPDGFYDLVFAVDSFPYIVNAGPATLAATFAEARRVLRPDGDVLIFNYSCRGDENRDMAEVSELGRAAGLELASFTAHAFHQWDASVFHLRALKLS